MTETHITEKIKKTGFILLLDFRSGNLGRWDGEAFHEYFRPISNTSPRYHHHDEKISSSRWKNHQLILGDLFILKWNIGFRVNLFWGEKRRSGWCWEFDGKSHNSELPPFNPSSDTFVTTNFEFNIQIWDLI